MSLTVSRGARRQGREEHWYRSAAERPCRHGRRLFPGKFAGPFLRAFDKETGQLLWEHELEANAEGIPRVSRERAAIHRVRRGRLMGHRRRSSVEESAAP